MSFTTGSRSFTRKETAQRRSKCSPTPSKRLTVRPKTDPVTLGDSLEAEQREAETKHLRGPSSAPSSPHRQDARPAAGAGPPAGPTAARARPRGGRRGSSAHA